MRQHAHPRPVPCGQAPGWPAAVLRHVPVPMAIFAPSGRLWWANAAFRRSLAPELGAAGRPRLEQACPVADVRRHADTVLSGGGTWETDISGRSGVAPSWHVSLSRVPASVPPLLLATYTERAPVNRAVIRAEARRRPPATEPAADTAGRRERAGRLASLAAALERETTLDGVIRAATRRAAALLAASEASLWRRDGDALRCVHETTPLGRTGSTLEAPWRDDAAAALADGRSRLAGDEPARGAGRRRGPTLVAPLIAEHERIGILLLGGVAPRPEPADLAFADAVAAHCALAVRRALGTEQEHAARLDAERLGSLQERLVAVVGHDLRTPLNAITLATSLLARGAPLAEAHARSLERIRSSADRMNRIISDLLDVARARRAGGIPVRKAPTDLARLTARAVAEVQAIHDSRHIALATEGDTSLLADPERVMQVVSNLVGNAVQHSPPGAQVSVSARRERSAVVLSVRNEGPPIPAEALPSVFDPFKRASPPAEGSVGLGLFIVREIVEAHGGTVAVRSTADEGTTFTVSLPASSPYRAAATPPERPRS